MAASIKFQPSSPLFTLISQRIKREGSISIAAYMSICLSHPQYGYYMTRDPFGTAGDFTTAPEISQMFGEIVGVFIISQWQALGAPQPFHLIECGPGRGTLMADILRVLKKIPEVMQQLHIHLIEISPVLQDLQKQKLACEDNKICWHKHIDDLPQGSFALVANEFLDALPVEQFIFTNGKWFERRIGLDKGRLVFVLGEEKNIMRPAKDGDIFEQSPAQYDFIKKIAAQLRQNAGFALLIDYDTTQSGSGDTLQAVSKHKFAGALENPGAHDLTAHVDFASLKKLASHEGCTIRGPITQREFLIANNIEARAEILRQKNPEANILQALNRLISPQQMGKLFKVMIMQSPGRAQNRTVL